MENDRVFRHVFPFAVETFRQFHGSSLSRSLRERGLLPQTRELPPVDADTLPSQPEGAERGVFLEHERIGFPSFAHEWSPGMLYVAGLATLDIQGEALAAGFTLKDATPTNILFRGSRPVLVDYLSFIPVVADQYLWFPEGQFIRNFVLPLLLFRLTGESTQAAFLGRRDGLEPGDVYRKIGWTQRLQPSVFRFVTAPSWLAKSKKAAVAQTSRLSSDKNRSAFLREALHENLRNAFVRLSPACISESRWSDYMSEHNYDPVAFAAKEGFVREALTELSPRRVLDVGCNTGHFSRMAAVGGAEVVAVDYDAASVDHVLKTTLAENLNVLPLVVNLAWPSPALGWEFEERTSFLQRAEGYFDCALLLAVIHHLSATDGVPLPRIFALLSRLVSRGAVVEYVSTDDSMMQRLLHHKGHLRPSLSQAAFEAALAPWFHIAKRQPLSEGRRCLYLLNRKIATAS